MPRQQAGEPSASIGSDLLISWLEDTSAMAAVDRLRDTAVFDCVSGCGGMIIRHSASAVAISGRAIAELAEIKYRHRRSDGSDGVGLRELGSSPFVLAVRLYVPKPFQANVRRWLDEEHIERQLAVKGTMWYGGYESAATRFTFLNLWGLTDPAVIETPEWGAARDTEWRHRLSGAFDEQDRAVYRRIENRTSPQITESLQ